VPRRSPKAGAPEAKRRKRRSRVAATALPHPAGPWSGRLEELQTSLNGLAGTVAALAKGHKALARTVAALATDHAQDSARMTTALSGLRHRDTAHSQQTDAEFLRMNGRIAVIEALAPEDLRREAERTVSRHLDTVRSAERRCEEVIARCTKAADFINRVELGLRPMIAKALEVQQQLPPLAAPGLPGGTERPVVDGDVILGTPERSEGGDRGAYLDAYEAAARAHNSSIRS
jgi:hypothetical protein